MSSQISFVHLLHNHTPRPTPSFRSNVSYQLSSEEQEEEEEERLQSSEERKVRKILRIQTTVEVQVLRPTPIPRHSDPLPLLRRCTAPPLSNIEGSLAPPPPPPISRHRRIPFMRSQT
ncbi:hypothetical protein JCM3765_005074 [Sporobolomyces pararoseus]